MSFCVEVVPVSLLGLFEARLIGASGNTFLGANVSEKQWASFLLGFLDIISGLIIFKSN